MKATLLHLLLLAAPPADAGKLPLPGYEIRVVTASGGFTEAYDVIDILPGGKVKGDGRLTPEGYARTRRMLDQLAAKGILLRGRSLLIMSGGSCVNPGWAVQITYRKGKTLYSASYSRTVLEGFLRRKTDEDRVLRASLDGVARLIRKSIGEAGSSPASP